ncbi:hypothetical protein [uncultured Nonlabens sp.]|uniref:hypothetical protein n=1 Tax=uncultured Nonlabens sp. TaxID=859306 RepID=UPI00262B7EB5|nr:hypothetical protein [uncultured Nonlabens sp.]
MNNIKLIAVIIISHLFFVSCNDDDNIETLPANLGIYELQSLESSIEMDLDYDGIASTDFKEELQLLWFSFPFRQEHHHLELYESQTKGKYWLETEGMPRDDYNGFHQDLNYRFKPQGRTHSLFIENEEIVSFVEDEPYFNHLDPTDILGQSRPYLIEFDTSDKITMELTQHFYDHMIDEWIEVSLIAKFNKKEENL